MNHIIIEKKAKKIIINFVIFANTSYNRTSAENDKVRLCLYAFYKQLGALIFF